MKTNKYKYLYGPVFSWRLGVSLGIDPLSQKDKICSFDCIYCQINKASRFSRQRKVYISETELVNELRSLPAGKFDYITFSGRGEPTLAKNLGKMIRAVKKVRKEKIAVITNSSLLGRKDVISDLLQADCVLVKLDAFDQPSLEMINRPMPQYKLRKIIKDIKHFRKLYHKKLALQIMFIKENINSADKIAQLVREINPDEVQLNTPLRKCAVKPLSRLEFKRIKKYFKGFKTISVYDIHKKAVRPLSSTQTLVRRGKT